MWATRYALQSFVKFSDLLQNTKPQEKSQGFHKGGVAHLVKIIHHNISIGLHNHFTSMWAQKINKKFCFYFCNITKVCLIDYKFCI